jgi:hypothetical protein
MSLFKPNIKLILMIKTETIKRKTKKKEIKPVMMNFISRKITK